MERLKNLLIKYGFSRQSGFCWLNFLLFLWMFCIHGLNVSNLTHYLMIPALVFLSWNDIQQFRISNKILLYILSLGLLGMLLDASLRMSGILGFFSLSCPLTVLYLLSGGRSMGGGDIKLMAVTGLVLGWRKNLLAFVIGSLLGCVLHWRHRKWLPFGLYLSLGIYVALLWGDRWIAAYLRWPGLNL